MPEVLPLGEICEALKNADLRKQHKMASLYLQMSIRYYHDVLKQARLSFYCALGASAVGVLFFISAACAACVMSKSNNVGWISLIAGALLQVISGTCFYLYGKASVQFGTFHICLDRSNRFLLANNICQRLGDPKKTETRAYLVHAIAEAAMLTPSVVNGERGRRPDKSPTPKQARRAPGITSSSSVNEGQSKTVQ
jgi:hypothetical protein